MLLGGAALTGLGLSGLGSLGLSGTLALVSILGFSDSSTGGMIDEGVELLGESVNLLQITIDSR